MLFWGNYIDQRQSRGIGADSFLVSASRERKPVWDIRAAPSAAIRPAPFVS